jgi:micrococcal nuclease
VNDTPARRRAAVALSATWTLVALVVAVEAGAGCDYPPPPAGLTVTTVRRVIDGGRFQVRLGRRTETVRYLGVVVPRLAADPPLLVAGQQVGLQLDDPARQPDGSLRAYVYAGEMLVNAELLCRGHAEAATDLPPHRYQALFQRLEREARDAGRGRWPRVTVRDGAVSVDFTATPGDEALQAIARASGVEVEVPAAAAKRTLTLAIASRPLEEVLERVLVSLDLGGMAVVYGPLGRVIRVIVVETGQGRVPAARSRR